MERLRALLSAHSLEVWLERTQMLAALIDRETTLLEWNPACGRLLPGGVPVPSLREMLRPESLAACADLCRAALQGQAPRFGTLVFPGALGASQSYDCSFFPLPDGNLIFLAERSAADISLEERTRQLSHSLEELTVDNEAMKRKLQQKQVEIDAIIMQAQEVAHTDELTFLANRRQIIGDLQREVMHADRYGTPLSISMLDIDHFKNVNDTYGHAIGDIVLRDVARYLRDNIREPDIVGRYGGEEFLVLLPNGRLQAAEEQAGRLCQLLRSTPIIADGKEYRVTISAGVAQYRAGQEDWQKLLSRADAAMYAAKSAGRDRWASAG